MIAIVEAALAVVGILLMLAGMAQGVGAMIAVFRAWGNGVSWWSGGLMWFNVSRQPAAARPHIRAAWRRYGYAAVLCFAGAVLLIFVGENSGAGARP